MANPLAVKSIVARLTIHLVNWDGNKCEAIGSWVEPVSSGRSSFIDGRLDPILASVALGLLIVGIWLKMQYQRHLRSNPKGR